MLSLFAIRVGSSNHGRSMFMQIYTELGRVIYRKLVIAERTDGNEKKPNVLRQCGEIETNKPQNISNVFSLKQHMKSYQMKHVYILDQNLKNA